MVSKLFCSCILYIRESSMIVCEAKKIGIALLFQVNFQFLSATTPTIYSVLFTDKFYLQLTIMDHCPNYFLINVKKRSNLPITLLLTGSTKS